MNNSKLHMYKHVDGELVKTRHRARTSEEWVASGIPAKVAKEEGVALSFLTEAQYKHKLAVRAGAVRRVVKSGLYDVAISRTQEYEDFLANLRAGKVSTSAIPEMVEKVNKARAEKADTSRLPRAVFNVLVGRSRLRAEELAFFWAWSHRYCTGKSLTRLPEDVKTS